MPNKFGVDVVETVFELRGMTIFCNQDLLNIEVFGVVNTATAISVLIDHKLYLIGVR